MELIRGLHNLRERHRGSVVTIGAFDGVHRGHQAVIRDLLARSQDFGLPSTVILFEPLPREYFAPVQSPPRLMSFREKFMVLRHLGVDRVLRIRFDRQQDAILKAVDARSKERLRYLTNTLQTRKQQEIDDIGTVLDELEKAIQSELKKGEQPEQLSLFTEDERTQLSRDIAALDARLTRIPDERKMETEAIEVRYAKLDDRTFPVAVIFIVPEGSTR